MTEIPSRGRGGYADDEDPCADCAETDCRGGWRWLLLPLLVAVVVAVIYVLVPEKPSHHSSAGSYSGELSEELGNA